MRSSELRKKEVICTTDGRKLGYAADWELNEKTFRVTALYCRGKGMFGALGESDEVKIPVELLEVIGSDIVLVRGYETKTTVSERSSSFWDRFFESEKEEM